MSKGSTHIRVGRVHRFVKGLEMRVQIMKNMQSQLSQNDNFDGKIEMLESIIIDLKNEFGEVE